MLAGLGGHCGADPDLGAGDLQLALEPQSQHRLLMILSTRVDPVGFQNSATSLDLGFYAARSYSLMRPLRTGRRLIRFRDMSGWGGRAGPGRGGRSWRLRWGRRPL